MLIFCDIFHFHSCCAVYCLYRMFYGLQLYPCRDQKVYSVIWDIGGMEDGRVWEHNIPRDLTQFKCKQHSHGVFLFFFHSKLSIHDAYSIQMLILDWKDVQAKARGQLFDSHSCCPKNISSLWFLSSTLNQVRDNSIYLQCCQICRQDLYGRLKDG